MLLHDREFFDRELAGFEQDMVGRAELADIVHRRRFKDRLGKREVVGDFLGDQP